MNYLFIIPLLVLPIGNIKSELKTLNIMGLLPMTGEKWSGGGACLTAVHMALRQVNEREDILTGYKLDLTWRDGKVRHYIIAGFCSSKDFKMETQTQNALLI